MTSSPGPDTDAASGTGADAAFWDPNRHLRHEDWIGFLGAEPAEPADEVVDAPAPTASEPAEAPAALDLDALLAGASDDLLPER